MPLLPKLEPRHYTYIGFLSAFGGLLFVTLSILLILNWVPQLIYWPMTIGIAILFLLISTLAFHKMGKKIEL